MTFINDYKYEPPVYKQVEELIEDQSTSLEDLDKIEMEEDNTPYYEMEIEQQQQDSFQSEEEQNKQKLLNKAPDLQNSRTKYLSNKANFNIAKKHEASKIENFSLQKLFSVISESLVGIMNDLLTANWQEESVIDIFTKEERLFSLGVVFVISTLFFIFFKNRS